MSLAQAKQVFAEAVFDVRHKLLLALQVGQGPDFGQGVLCLSGLCFNASF